MIDRDPSSLYEFDSNWGEPVDQRLTRPVMVVGLDGWVDAGMGASTAIAELLTSSPTMQVVSFDTEMLVDQRARRPIVRLEDGVTTELTWPVIRMVAGKDRVGADIVYLTGPEPDFRWPTFIDAVVGLVHDLQVRTVVGLGAFPAPTPHTQAGSSCLDRPAAVGGPGRAGGTVHGTLEVPAGVQAALEVSLGIAEIPVIGLWARVPHYVSAMPYPEASAALIEGLCAVTGTVLDSSSLRRAGEESRRQVDELIGANPEHLEMVRRLEAALDSEEVSSTGLDVDVPSGEEIAAELEQFLRGEGHREA